MPSEETNKITREEWRELGFFYEYVDAAKLWRLRGSRAGLLSFADTLRKYTLNPRNRELSEHDHLGPYMYLTIGTWTKAEISDHWIAGPLEDLQRLSTFLRERLLSAQSGDTLHLRETFAPGSSCELELCIEANGFDPAAADTLCW